MLGDERVESRMLIWAAGVAASLAAAWLGIEGGSGGRVPVLSDLTLAGHSEIFVIGDTANGAGTNGPLPGVAPVAKQQAHTSPASSPRALPANLRPPRSATETTAI